tara:strand:- start:683 stop:943 length:261 start_codon:yes stop_codon:yes gene_type:complete
MTTTQVPLPAITLHGSGQQNLVDDLVIFAGRLEEALQALKDATPHPRDYNTVEEFNVALKQHGEWWKDLHRITGEVADRAFDISVI